MVEVNQTTTNNTKGEWITESNQNAEFFSYWEDNLKSNQSYVISRDSLQIQIPE